MAVVGIWVKDRHDAGLRRKRAMCIQLRCCKQPLHRDAVEDAGQGRLRSRQIGLVEFVKSKNLTKPELGHWPRPRRLRCARLRNFALEADADALWLPRRVIVS